MKRSPDRVETQPQLGERKRNKAPAGYIKRPVTRTKASLFGFVLTNPTPYDEKLAECWFLHPDRVPARMGFMLHGIHTKRAAHNLPDLSAKFPPTEVGRRPPAARGAALRT